LPLTYFSAVKLNRFFTAIPQQIASSSKVWADSAFPALAETVLFAIPYSLIVFWLEKKFKKSSPVLFWILALVVLPFVFGFLWMGFHNAVYGSDDVALVSTYVFGVIGTFLTMAFRSLIPFATVHFVSNLMLSLKKHGWFANDLTGFMLALIWIFCVLLFIYVYKADGKNSYSSG
jgi:hypothetical protein